MEIRFLRQAAQKGLSEAETRFFLEKIQPVLERNCFERRAGQKGQGRLFDGFRECFVDRGAERGFLLS
jgi:hypothetical protein